MIDPSVGGAMFNRIDYAMVNVHPKES